jgi:RimJ/RimL family protein N-acetyltransferase
MRFEQKKIITKKGNEIILRMILPNEAQALLDSMVEISSTSPYILTTPDFFKNTSVEFETSWINKYNIDPRSILVVAQFNNRIVGVLDFSAYTNAKTRHRGVLGISLHQSIRGEGVGEALFKKLIYEIQKVDDLTAVELSVMGENQQAYGLYKKMGFIEVGRNPRAFKISDDKFCDDIQMVLRL